MSEYLYEIKKVTTAELVGKVSEVSSERVVEALVEIVEEAGHGSALLLENKQMFGNGLTNCNANGKMKQY